MVQSVSTDDPRTWAAVAARCASYLRSVLPAALENLEVAQLRDARCYRQRKEGVGGGPRHGTELQIGDEVYLKEPRHNTLECGLSKQRWVVRRKEESGVLTLQNAPGRSVQDHVTNVARASGSRPSSGGAGQTERGHESGESKLITYKPDESFDKGTVMGELGAVGQLGRKQVGA
ncbi:hypothetical protein CLOM_g4494 [Closterium sp. NIES-68]|nr:hypothetical protein CLOM_g4494 [Closterium sp. NIES-68]